MNEVTAAALMLRANGYAVVPQLGKSAYLPGWNKQELDEHTLCAETSKQGINIAVVTGLSRVGEGQRLVVLDLDVRGGAEWKKDAYVATRAIVGTANPTTKTGGGGAHWFYAVPESRLPPENKLVLAQGPTEEIDGKSRPVWTIELLANGHACTVPPSVHSSGQRYQWINGGPHAEPAPDSLYQAIEEARTQRPAAHAHLEPATRTWPELRPLGVKTASEPYPIEVLPDALRAAVLEVQAFTKAPLPLVVASALGALSVASQGHVDVQRAEKLRGPVSLYLLTIAPSGERKSTNDALFTGAITTHEREQAEAAKPYIKEYLAKEKAWRAEHDGVCAAIKQVAKSGKPQKGKFVQQLRDELCDLEGQKPKQPRVPRFMRCDETPENLAWALAKEWPSAGLLSAEGGVVLGAHAMGENSLMRNLGLLNILWDGGVHSIGRRTSESYTLRGVRLSVSIQVQEETLRAFNLKSNGLPRGIGFYARFLVSWPESTQGFRQFTEPPPQWPKLERLNGRIGEILKIPLDMDEDGALRPVVLTFSPEAKIEWVGLHNAIEEELAPGGELTDVRDVASKAADNVARMAGLFHVLESTANDWGARSISAAHVHAAGMIVMWHLNEALRYLGQLALSADLADPARLSDWLVKVCRTKGVDLVSRSDAMTRGPLRRKAKLEPALRELGTHGHTRLEQVERATMIRVNSALLKLTT